MAIAIVEFCMVAMFVTLTVGMVAVCAFALITLAATVRDMWRDQ